MTATLPPIYISPMFMKRHNVLSSPSTRHPALREHVTFHCACPRDAQLSLSTGRPAPREHVTFHRAYPRNAQPSVTA